MIKVGDSVGDCTILGKLSQGGMATLYLAARSGASGFSKHVAVKVVHEHLAVDPTFVEMFVDEALLSSRIHHPNVVHIEELREQDGQHILVMEYVSGVSLNQLIRRLSRLRRRMTPEVAAYIAVQVADGLHAAHELKDAHGQLEGLVHRDVSPQNVLLAWEGYVKLIDFGVAKARSRFQQTTSASLKGKVRYMAPEQARGLDVDRRTDVYALGIVLWEMLTMRPRFVGDNDFALLDQVRSPEHVSARELNPAVTPGLDAVLKKALSPEPEQRFATAQEFRRALAIAVPTALALDASHLSELVRAACAEELNEARHQLPHSMILPGDVAADAKLPRAPLRTLTVSASQVLGFEYDSSASLPAGRDPRVATVSRGALPRPSVEPAPTPATGASLEAVAPPISDVPRGSFAPPVPTAPKRHLSPWVTGGVLFALFVAACVYVLFPPTATETSTTSTPPLADSEATGSVPAAAATPDAAASQVTEDAEANSGGEASPMNVIEDLPPPPQDVQSQAADRLRRPGKRRRRRRFRPRPRRITPLR